MHLLILLLLLFNKYLSSAYVMKDTVLGMRDATVNKSDKNPCSHRADILIGEHR